MNEINFKPLFEYLDKKFGQVEADIAEVKSDVRVLKTAVDGLAKLVKDFRDEHIIIHKRLEVLEEWAKQVSKKLGISLPF
jgi:hypothetical protein